MANIQFPNLEAERARANMTQEEVCSSIGVYPKLYRSYVSGDAEIPASKLIALSTLYGCSIDYLLGRVKEAR